MESAGPVVFLVDDDADLRAALARLLRSAHYQVRAFNSGSEFLASHEAQTPGCVILDLSMPGCDGLEVQNALRTSAGPLRPVIFLTGNGSIGASVLAIKSGAVNFLLKPVEESELFAAVDEALRIDADRRANASSHLEAESRVMSLTPRERQVLEYVIAGRLNKQIAAELGTVEKTIKVHRARVMHKMGARSVAELVSVAAKAGIRHENVQKTFQLDLGPIRTTTIPALRLR